MGTKSIYVVVVEHDGTVGVTEDTKDVIFYELVDACQQVYKTNRKRGVLTCIPFKVVEDY
jgi:hypothetical protein